jgi:hypothetical protein
MTRPTQVHALYGPSDPDYPRLLSVHPRNASVDWQALSRYAEQGAPTAPESFDLFVKPTKTFDAVLIPGIVGPLISARSRDVFQAVVGDCVEFLPLSVNGVPFWLLRVVRVVDALDMTRSEVVYGVHGGVKYVDVPVWVGARLVDPMMFRVPQLPGDIWATPAVVEAFAASGCDGLTFGPRGWVG